MATITYSRTAIVKTTHEADPFMMPAKQWDKVGLSQRYDELALIAHGLKTMLAHTISFSVADNIIAAARAACADIWQAAEEYEYEYRLAAVVREQGDTEVLTLCDEYLAKYC